MFQHERCNYRPTLLQKFFGEHFSGPINSVVEYIDRNNAQYWREEAKHSANTLMKVAGDLPRNGIWISFGGLHLPDGRKLGIMLTDTNGGEKPTENMIGKNRDNFLDISISNETGDQYGYFLRWSTTTHQIKQYREYKNGTVVTEISNNPNEIDGDRDIKRINIDDASFTPKLQSRAYESCKRIFLTALSALHPSPSLLP